MGWDNPDVYHQPEMFGLTPVTEIDWSDGNYRFEITAVWQHDDGTFYIGYDSGCSCPSPFEDHTALDSLMVLDLDVLAKQVQDYVTEYNDPDGYRSIYSNYPTDDDAVAFYQKVERAVYDYQRANPPVIEMVAVGDYLEALQSTLHCITLFDGSIEVPIDDVRTIGNQLIDSLATLVNKYDNPKETQ